VYLQQPTKAMAGSTLTDCQKVAIQAVGWTIYGIFVIAALGMAVTLNSDGSNFGFWCHNTSTPCTRAQLAGTSWTLDDYAYALGLVGEIGFFVLLFWVPLGWGLSACTGSKGCFRTWIWTYEMVGVVFFFIYAIVFFLIGLFAILLIKSSSFKDNSNDSSLNSEIQATWVLGIIQLVLLGCYFCWVIYEYTIFRADGHNAVHAKRKELAKEADKQVDEVSKCFAF
jgi:hypothetical protein